MHCSMINQTFKIDVNFNLIGFLCLVPVVPMRDGTLQICYEKVESLVPKAKRKFMFITSPYVLEDSKLNYPVNLDVYLE